MPNSRQVPLLTAESKMGLQSPTIKVDFNFVMVVLHDNHNKFTSKCIHVHRYRHSHWPARYLSVFLVLSTPQLKTSTLFILVSPLIQEHRSLGTRPSVFT